MRKNVQLLSVIIHCNEIYKCTYHFRETYDWVNLFFFTSLCSGCQNRRKLIYLNLCIAFGFILYPIRWNNLSSNVLNFKVYHYRNVNNKTLSSLSKHEFTFVIYITKVVTILSHLCKEQHIMWEIKVLCSYRLSLSLCSSIIIVSYLFEIHIMQHVGKLFVLWEIKLIDSHRISLSICFSITTDIYRFDYILHLLCNT